MNKLMTDEELKVLIKSHSYGDFSPGSDGEDIVIFSPKELFDLIKSQMQAHDEMISGQDMHEALMNYGVICEETSALSPEAVTIRMDLATYFYEMEQRERNKL